MSERPRRWLTVYCRATGSGQAWARIPVLSLIAFGALGQDGPLLFSHKHFRYLNSTIFSFSKAHIWAVFNRKEQFAKTFEFISVKQL